MLRFLKKNVVGLLVFTTSIMAADVYVSITEVGDDNLSVYMVNTVDVGGFQYTINDDPNAFDVTAASGGSAQTAGFLMSTNTAGLVLGFSLSGAVIPAGEGILNDVTLGNFSAEYCQLILTDLIFSDATGTALTVEFDQEGGFAEWGTPQQEDMAHLTMTNGIAESGNTGIVDILLENTMEIGGFQFTLADNPDLVTLLSAATTDRSAGFLFSTNPDGLVLGFSLTGATIAAGDGPIATLTFDTGTLGGVADMEFNELILSDPDGIALEGTFENGTFTVTGGQLPEPEITILSPTDGATIIGNDIDVSVSGDNMVDGDHYHGYVDGSMTGMYYSDDFTISDVPFGTHELTVTISDGTHVDYENESASQTILFTNTDVPPVDVTTLYLGEATIVALEEGDLALSMTNPEEIVAGFQLTLLDFPNFVDIVALNTTERTQAFSLTFNEQPDGSAIIVGFDLTGVGISTGMGPIMNITYLSTSNYNTEITVSIGEATSIISDPSGSAIDFESESGLITIEGDPHPGIFPPQDVSAIPGFQMINLSWTHPEPWDVVGYYISRDDANVGESELPNWVETDLETEAEYCYTIQAYNDFVISEPSEEVCATTLAQYFEEPANLSAQENGLEITLNWGPPPSVNACGNDAITGLPFEGEGSTVGETDDWLVQGSQGADFAYFYSVSEAVVIDVTTCHPASDFDTKLEIFTADGDCIETTTGNYDDDDTCEFSNLRSALHAVSLTPGQYYIVVDGFGGGTGNFGIYVTESGQMAEGPADINDSISWENEKAGTDYNMETWSMSELWSPTNTREFEGYEVYRDNQLLTYTTANTYVDTDGLWYLETYCYNVTAVYTDGTSGFSNTACETPQLGEPSGLSAFGEGGAVALEWNAHPDNAQSSFYVYREGVFLAETTAASYSDATAEHDVEYCYTVTAFYESIGESPESNEACGMWMILPPTALSAEAGPPNIDPNTVHLEWMPPGSEVTLTVEILTDIFSNETSWDLYSENGEMIFNMQDALEDNITYTWDVTLTPGTYTWTIHDSYGDGIYVPGYYTLAIDGVVFAENYDFGGSIESVTFNTNNLLLSVSNWEYLNPAPFEKDMIITDEMIAEQELADPTITIYQNTRELESYNVYRDDEFLVNLPPETLSYDDTGIPNLVEYCYTMTSVFTEGVSPESNEACATPTPGNGPLNLSAHGENDYILMDWDAPLLTEGDVEFYIIYRDGSQLTTTTNLAYQDSETVHDTEYCYTITAMYPAGESFGTEEVCTMWELCPPSNLDAEPGDRFVDLSWQETSCGDEVFMQYDDGVLANAFYFYDTYELGYAHGMRFDVGSTFNVEAASLHILSEGDAYWPWPDATHGPVRVLIFDDNNGLPGNLLFEDEATAEDGWATVYPGLTGLSGSFHVVGTHQEGWTDLEGFGVDGGVDHPDNMVTMQAGAWSTGDVLGYGGDYMISALVYAQGGLEPMSFGDLPSDPFTDLSVVESIPENILGDEVGYESHPDYYPDVTRELLDYTMYRDGNVIATFAPEEYSYRDEDDLVNNTEYCYTMVANYTEGPSQPTNEVCATPFVPAPTELTATPLLGQIHLDWMVPPEGGGEIFEYIIYRDGDFLDSSDTNSYDDGSTENDINYCYTVTALYDGGESAPTNEACAMWMILPPAGLTAEAGDEVVHLEWQEGVFAPCADEVINSLPFTAEGSNIGETDDWDIQASDGADYSYGLTIYGDTFINVNTCWSGADYDTKLEIFTADDECLGTTTGNYNDDSGCTETGELVSALNDVLLSEGTYYIVVDGFGGQEGNFQISVWESEGAQDSSPMSEEEFNASVLENLAYESEKIGIELTLDDYNGSPFSDGQPNLTQNRELLSYDIQRDGSFLVSVEPGLFEYDDTTVENFTDYCYTVSAVFDEGQSPDSNEACAEPLPGIAPTNLVALAITDHIELTWNAGGPGLLNYVIYRDDIQLDTTGNTDYTDNTAEHDTNYCYTVTAMYSNGESYPSNEFCAMWELGSVTAWVETEGNGFIEINWTDPAGGGGGGGGNGETIEEGILITSIPFDDSRDTNDYLDDYDEVCPYSGSLAPDVVYTWIASPGQYHVDICNSEYDTKLYIYDENLNLVDCSDDSCNSPDGSPFRSDINVNITTQGFYYVIVDGYSSQAGIYNLSITEGFLLSEGHDNQPEKDDAIPYVELGNGGDIEPAEPRTESRALLGFEIFRDGDNIDYIDDSEARAYVDMPVENGIEHCYVIVPVYDEGPALPSNEVCGAGDAGPMCPPENFDVEIVDGLPLAHLTWDVPGDCDDGGGGGDGNVLVTIMTDTWANETSWNIVDSGGTWVDGIEGGTLTDLTLYTWEVDLAAGSYTFNILDSFGDGIYCSADGYYQIDVNGTTIGGGPGIGCDFGSGMSHDFTTGGQLLSSSEFQFEPPIQGEKDQVEYDMTGIENVEVVVYVNEDTRTERLNGYRILRDDEEIATVGPDETEYDDTEMSFGEEHCWRMVAIYDEGVSNTTEEICGTVVDPGLISHLYFEEGTMEAGGSESFNISLTNAANVAGFQFTVNNDPNLLTAIELVTTDRTEEFLVEFNVQGDGSVIIVGFSLTGDEIEAGSGPILELTYEAGGGILEPTDVEISFSDIYLGGPLGELIITFGHDGNIMVNPAGASELSVGDGYTSLGGTTSIEISLSNEFEIGGFQFDLLFDPEIATLVEVLPTVRTSGWSVSGGSDTGTIIGFSLMGIPIDPGEGPIVEVVVMGDAEGIAQACLSAIVISDTDGMQIPASATCGIFTVIPGEDVDPPVITDISAGSDQIDIDWTWEAPENAPIDEDISNSRSTVDLSFESYVDGQLGIFMTNEINIAGFQFNLDSDNAGYTLNGVSGGTAAENGMLMSTNTGGLVLGFSLSGDVIPAGEGVLVYADVTFDGDEACFSLSETIFSDADGEAVDVDTGEEYCVGGVEVLGCTDPDAFNFDPEATVDDGSCVYEGCMDPEALNFDPDATIECDECCEYPFEATFNVYRDGSWHDTVVGMYSYSDTGLGGGETYCYTVTAVLEDGTESDYSNEECATTSSDCAVDMYSNLPDPTGEFSLIIVSDVMGIEMGDCDEIGVFDANAILNEGNCETEIGELLVGSTVWTGEQASISAIGSLDYCAFGGDQFPGYVEDNPIVYRYYSAADGMEYAVEAEYTAGNGTFGELIISAVLHIVTDVTQ
ncbi:MAG: hypothetical protein HOK29_04920, partial [Candidatus Marinimicrobia bacterium]|nr:hypothetical protein [Candidatus Neomarinimicrobiota bacterium]